VKKRTKRDERKEKKIGNEVGFESTIPAFEREKTVRDLDRIAPVTKFTLSHLKKYAKLNFFFSVRHMWGITVFQNAVTCLSNYADLPVICI
jgi:hypothetical protein